MKQDALILVRGGGDLATPPRFLSTTFGDTFPTSVTGDIHHRGIRPCHTV